jgi:hypothetical protein
MRTLCANRATSWRQFAHLKIEQKTVWPRNESFEDNVKRLSIKSHYLFVANAASRAIQAAKFTGLNGSQASENLIATSSLTRRRRRYGRRWAGVYLLEFPYRDPAS